MAKKKKIASNPARGFATTSIASKLKPDDLKPYSEQSEEPGPEIPSKSQTPSTHAGTSRLQDERGDDGQKLSDLTPEEVELRLENAEVQSIVDKHSDRSTREASRQAKRLLEERRIARKQPLTHKLYLHRFLDERIVDEIFLLGKSQIRAEDALTSAQPSAEFGRSQTLREDDLILKLWILQKTLKLLKFQEGHIKDALEYSANHAHSFDQVVGAVWGLEECIEWLALSRDETSLPNLDDQTKISQDVSDSDPETVDLAQSQPKALNSAKGYSLDDHKADAVDSAQSNDKGLNYSSDSDESDLPSDVEPENLVDTYLNLRCRLYRIQPSLVEERLQDRKKSKSKSSVAVTIKNNKTKKLLDKIGKIELDPLFDQNSAEQEWVQKRNQLAQELASNNKADAKLDDKDEVTKHERSQLDTSSESHKNRSRRASAASSSEDEHGLSALFQANSNGVNNPDMVDSGITIRDFGKITGLQPRRLLEETVRSRDPGAKLKYAMVSQVAFASRHFLRIDWSKPSDIIFPLEIDGTTSRLTPKTCDFEMHSVATPDSKQSEAFISVIALFQIFSQSPREGKVYLRLPPNCRDLWVEFENQHKTNINDLECEAVGFVKSLVRSVLNNPHEITSKQPKISLSSSTKPDNTDPIGPQAQPSTAAAMQRSTSLKEIWDKTVQKLSFQEMLKHRKLLPIHEFKELLISTIAKNQITIVCGETGCGKSTQLPTFILEQNLMSGSVCKIYCTQPRRISAISLAQRVNLELGGSKEDLGTKESLVGYAIRLETKISASTRLIYATTGILLRILESDNDLAETTHVIVDEVHERSIETDFLLIILRAMMQRRPDLKIILMSATLNAERFSTYFGEAPVIDVPGRTFPVQSRFLEDVLELTEYALEGNHDEPTFDEKDETDDNISVTKSSPLFEVNGDYSMRTKHTLKKMNPYKIDYGLIISLIRKIYSEADLQVYGKAVLIFLPGIGEIRQLIDMLNAAQFEEKIIIHALHSAIPSEDQQKAFDPSPSGYRKVVVSTNIAETGVTIPDVTCVIDIGKHREMRFDEKRQASRLIESFISRANAKQRRGRAGRVQSGICFHLFTKAQHDTGFAEEQAPEMLRLSLQDLVMRVKICKLGDIQESLALAVDPPSVKNIRRAIDSLIEVGALTASEDLTVVGRKLSKLPLDPYLGKLVLNGAAFGCLDMSLTCAALLSNKSIFATPVGGKQQALASRALFAKGGSDLLTDFNAYQCWKRVCLNSPETEQTYCRKNYLNLQSLATIEDLKAQLLMNLTETGIITLERSEKLEISRISNIGSRKRRFVTVPETHKTNEWNTGLAATVISLSFYPKLLTRDGKGWRNAATNQPITMHPSSILRNATTTLPASIKFLSFYSILQTATTAKYYNAMSVSCVPILALVLFAGEASFNSVAQVVSIDGRIRFSSEADTARRTWKEYIALKLLRRYTQDVLFGRSRSARHLQKTDIQTDNQWKNIWRLVLESLNANLEISTS